MYTDKFLHDFAFISVSLRKVFSWTIHIAFVAILLRPYSCRPRVGNNLIDMCMIVQLLYKVTETVDRKPLSVRLYHYWLSQESQVSNNL